MLKAEICITLKKTVADPQGLTIKQALESMGYQGLEKVRIGKFIIIELSGRNKVSAQKEAEEMCAKLLANPIIEDYRIEIKED
ncbi:MAG: phosphoribosylformylglycinamidine synthase subunit PurS [Candidatus Omnitrophota bacterium]|nr:phosphoribosylformylglycinamidine synthase subunit PurS [Candidatus Omnitrophota bacterium]